MNSAFRTMFAGLVSALSAAMLAVLLTVSTAIAQDAEARVIVPDVPGGALVSGCYEAIGRLYSKYRFEFCLKQRGTYEIRGAGVRCEGRLDWNARGATVSVELRRARCGNGVAWSADTMTCRPNLLLGFLGLITDRPFLNALTCDYRPAPGTAERPTRFTVRRTGA